MNIAILCLTLATLANAFANVLMKKASAGEYSNALGVYLSPLFIGGMVLFGLNMLFYTRALKNFPLATAYPILVGGSLTIVALVAYFWLKEPLTAQHLIGIALIITGLCLVV